MTILSRRELLQGILAGSAATALSPLLPGFRLNTAHAHVNGAPFPTIFIMLYGGIDSAMHWDAKAGIPNRNVQNADIRETASGIRWYEPLLSPLAPHMEDMTLVRNIKVTAGHAAGIGDIWFGETNDATSAESTPWVNYLSSELLTRKNVIAPALAAYYTFDPNIVNLISHNNRSPHSAAAAQRIKLLKNFSDALDVLEGLPPKEIQKRAYELTAQMDKRHYSQAVQPQSVNGFLTGNTQASALLDEPPLTLWPPSENTKDLFNLSNDDLIKTTSQGNQRLIANLAFAFESARLQTSHIIYIEGKESTYDSHSANDANQRNAANKYMPSIAKLLSALKATQSPIDSSLSMFETTNVVITSEMGRSVIPDSGDGSDGFGTIHGNNTQAALFGGNFKRGIAFGATDANDLSGIPADFKTGELNQGELPSMKSFIATVLKANKVDPAGWTSAPPIDAVLKP